MKLTVFILVLFALASMVSAAPVNGCAESHVATNGQTCSTFSSKYQITVNQLQKLNSGLGNNETKCVNLVSGKSYCTKATVPKATVPKATVPKATVPKATVPKATVPKTTVPKTTVPKATVPKATVPKATVPKATVPKATVPKTTVPKATVPKATVPKATVPKATVPKATVPKATVPKATVPKATVPKATVPKATVPKATVPKETVPKETVPKATVPKETVPKAAVPKKSKNIQNSQAPNKDSSNIKIAAKSEESAPPSTTNITTSDASHLAARTITKCKKYHVVKAGDTCKSIAKEHNIVEVQITQLSKEKSQSASDDNTAVLKKIGVTNPPPCDKIVIGERYCIAY
ncbi:hypothetical protein J3Q64DRAFT_1852382 [Phycomyces blakesleeanus]|uniref:LysM domain-containing protein n=1 Tax=Phycomyces blakesleeanus TaxID=4837 RepID=A0ABR3APN3_PHYBL